MSFLRGVRRFLNAAALGGLLLSIRASAEGLLKRFRIEGRRPSAGLNSESLGGSSGGLAELEIGVLPQLPINAIAATSLKRVLKQESFGGALIKGSWALEISDTKERLIFASGRTLGPVDAAIRKALELRVKNALANRHHLREQLRLNDETYANSALAFDPELIIDLDAGAPKLEWSADAFNQDETSVTRWTLDERGSVLTKKVLHSGFESIGQVFPQGFRHSQLSEQKLPTLTATHLTNEKMLVSAANAETVEVPDGRFLFSTEDHRFDQVQVFFSASEILSYFESEFHAAPLFKLDIKIGVGERSNAAMYHRGRIRIGTGDGRRYEHMLRDPSIVMHEVAHAIVEKYARLPVDGQGGALNEAFADYFAASVLGNPQMGNNAFLEAPFIRSLENKLYLHEVQDRGHYVQSQVVSGTLWDLRMALGAKVADRLAFETLCRLGPEAKLADFPIAWISAHQQLFGQDPSVLAMSLFKERGWLE